MQTIIHISGSPGSGKTTLGEKLKKKYGSKIYVHDTDGFIQHNNKNGKKLLKIKSQPKYKQEWKKILGYEIEQIIKKT